MIISISMYVIHCAVLSSLVKISEKNGLIKKILSLYQVEEWEKLWMRGWISSEEYTKMANIRINSLFE